MPGETHPSSLPDLLERAVARHEAGDLATATRLYLEILQREPRHFEALHRLGVARAQAGDAAAAVRHLTAAIAVNPQYPEALCSRGNALYDLKRFDEALADYERALALRPDAALLHNNRGNTLCELRRYAEALVEFDRALVLEPGYLEARVNRGNVLQDLRRHQEALAEYDRALAAKPDFAVAQYNRGNALLELKRPQEALASYDRALALKPDHADALNGRGDALLELLRLEEAARCFERAIEVKPREPTAYWKLGAVRQEQGRWEEALRYHERALDLDPGSAVAEYCLALACLFGQEFERAWPHYERRLDTPGIREHTRKDVATVERYERLPGWRGPGEALEGEVAIWGEQGIGDQVLFSTLIPELIAARVPFLYEVDRRLLPAYARAFPGSRFVTREELPREELTQASRVLFAGSLPGLFRCSRASFARQPRRLLSALPEQVARFRQQMDAPEPGLKVAISWRSAREGRVGRIKSAELMQFAPLLELEGVRFVDVQYGDTRAERQAVEDATGVRLLHFEEVDYYRDLEELLAILEACDLLITTSNATAHFAGALGRPVWLLYPAERPPFHYWAHDGSHRCLWYPSVEIVSAPQLADWASLIQHVKERIGGDSKRVDWEPGGWLESRTGRGRGASAATLPDPGTPAGIPGLSRMPGETHPSSLPDLLERAVARHQAGDFVMATRLYLEILQREPRHFEALHRLGVARAQAGDAAAAVRHLTAAIAVNPQSAEAHVHLAHARMAAGETEAALGLYDQALALRPEYPEALYSRGNALQALKRHEEALASYDRALAIVPGRAEILGNRGNTLHDLKRYEEALASYDQAIAIVPGVALLHNNRGNTLRELGRFEEALASLDRALAIAPDYVGALSNRGNTLQDLRRYEEALGSFDRALAQSPGNAVVHYNLGNVLHEIKQYEAALASYDKALAIDPEFSDALNGRGNAQSKLERHEEAVACYEKALAIRPDIEYAAGMLVNARMQCCDWRGRDEEFGRLTADIRSGKRSITPFMFLGVSDSPQDQLLCSRIWARDKCPAAPVPIWKGERYRHDRIRLAYLSADLHEHVMAYRLAGLFEMHDSARFETTAISFGPDAPGETRSRLKGAFSRFVDVQRQSDREVADLLRELEIDIAVDLNGLTTGCRTRIFAFRAAPVQVNYLGYPGTMGADYIDYILADRVVIPKEHHPYYTEKVVYLPDTYQVNDSRRVIADRTPARFEAGLPEQGFVFCSFNNNYKISPAVFDVWLRLLDKVEGSVLWLYESNAAAMRNLKKRAADNGIAPERLVFAPKIKLEDYLARHRLADLALDTLPYNGHGTSSDALWAGLPVLTCLGKSFAGRVGASLLNAVGLDELITHSLEAYEALALQLATNPKHIADIKSKLAANRNTFPLFNTDRFRRHIEAAYTTMWERYQRGEPPASFAVASIGN